MVRSSASIRRIPVHRLLVYSILSHNLFALILEIFCDHPLENRACLLAVPRCSQIFSPVCLPKTTLWNLANNTIASTTTLKFILSLHGVAAAAGAEGPVSNQEKISKTNNQEIKLQRWQSHLFSCFTDFFHKFFKFSFFYMHLWKLKKVAVFRKVLHIKILFNYNRIQS